MSGGSMDYVCFKIEQAAEDVATYLREVEQREDTLDFLASDYYIKHYPDDERINSRERLKANVLGRLRDAVHALKVAAVYARRVEWLSSGDDGYESFVIRTDHELSKLNEGRQDE